MSLENYIHNKLKKNIQDYESIIKIAFFDKDNNKAMLNLNIKNRKYFGFKNPEWQRVEYNDKINEIVKYQELVYNKTRKFMFINNIVIDYCKQDNEFYLIDGQHRFSAAIYLSEYYNHNVNIWFEFIMSENIYEVKEHFDLINKHTLQPENVSELAKKIFKYYENSYPKIFKSGVKTTKKPYILSNIFISAISFLIAELNKKYSKEHTFDELISLINNKNNICSMYDLNKWKQIKDLKNLESIINIANENNFYLGIYTASKKEYIYKWILEVLELDAKQKKSKQKIPPMKKQEVWNYWNNNLNESTCFCCRQTIIYSNSYHCGHIIAESKNGLMNVNNLRPICQSCNSSMGNKNMRDYMKEFYPDNLSILDFNK